MINWNVECSNWLDGGIDQENAASDRRCACQVTEAVFDHNIECIYRRGLDRLDEQASRHRWAGYLLLSLSNSHTNKFWIVEETLHLATLLGKYGYFFAVNPNGSTLNVKDDGELYRFQAPYFWVSTNWNVGNTDYGDILFIYPTNIQLNQFQFLAIYLLKRTMRNQEKHALSDIENVRNPQSLIDILKKSNIYIEAIAGESTQKDDTSMGFYKDASWSTVEVCSHSN